MRFLKEGHKGKAICRTCKGMVATTYLYKEYLLDSGVKVPRVLQNFCDSCGRLASIPAQSTPKIREYRVEKNTSLEVRISQMLEDVLYNIGDKSKMEVSRTFRSLIAFYTREDGSKGASMRGFRNHPLLKEPRKARISIKVPKDVDEKVRGLASSLSMSKSDCIVTLLIKAKEDLLDNESRRTAKEFYGAAEIMAS